MPPDCALDSAFDLSAFTGRWYITAGLNPLFDTFPCQASRVPCWRACLAPLAAAWLPPLPLLCSPHHSSSSLTSAGALLRLARARHRVRCAEGQRLSCAPGPPAGSTAAPSLRVLGARRLAHWLVPLPASHSLPPPSIPPPAAKINWRIPTEDPLTGEADFLQRSTMQRFVQVGGRGHRLPRRPRRRLQPFGERWRGSERQRGISWAPTPPFPSLVCPLCSPQDPASPAQLANHGNEYLHYEDDW